MATVFLRTIIIYFLLFLTLRLMGKRQVGELQVSELITTFMLSEFAVIPMQNSAIPVVYAVIPIFVLLSLEVITSFILTKSSVMRRIFCGRPSVVIRRGELLQGELKRLRMNLPELLSELRLKDIDDVSAVDYAVVEENGKLSVFPKASERNATPRDLGKAPAESGIAHAVVVDGEVNPSSLSLAGRSRGWLDGELEKASKKLGEVFLMTVNDAGDVKIIEKNDKTAKNGGGEA